MKPTKKQAREAKLLAELSNNHGYLLGEVKPGERIGIAINFKTGVSTSHRVVYLRVPMDSALAIAMPVPQTKKAKDAAKVAANAKAAP